MSSEGRNDLLPERGPLQRVQRGNCKDMSVNLIVSRLGRAGLDSRFWLLTSKRRGFREWELNEKFIGHEGTITLGRFQSGDYNTMRM